MSDVVSLKEVRAEPVPEVVEALRLLLHKAEQGEVIGIAVAATTTGRCTGTLYEIGDGTISDLYLALARLQLLLLNHEG